MRRLLVTVMQRSLVLGLAMLLCGGAGAQSPDTIAELHARWVELLRYADGDISATAFERMVGLELLTTTHNADGAIGRSVQITRLDGSSLRANIHSYSDKRFMRASLEWTPGYFAVLTGRSCIDLSRLTKDLAAMGWTARPDAGGVFAALFRRSDNLAAYGSAVEGRGRQCRLYYQSHYFDAAPLDKGRPALTKKPEG